MRRLTVPIEALLPTQATVYEDTVDFLRQRYERGKRVNPIPVVPLTRDGGRNQNLILPNGHHRAYAQHQLGIHMVRAVLIQDEDLERQLSGGVVGFTSLDGFRNEYTTIWRPDLEQNGIYGIHDLRMEAD